MPSNYTQKETDKLVNMYTDNPCMETVEKLMTLLNRPKKSIISKLVKEGVYVTRGYRTKTGEVPVTKLELVRAIEDALDIPLPGLDKTPKTTLKALSRTIVQQTECFEEALDQIQELSESHRVLEEMSNIKRKSFFYDPIATLGEE